MKRPWSKKSNSNSKSNNERNERSKKKKAILSVAAFVSVITVSVFNIVMVHRNISPAVDLVSVRPMLLGTHYDIDTDADTNSNADNRADGDHKVAGLSCEKYGGPSDEISSQMIFWSDIPSDSLYQSPFLGNESQSNTDVDTDTDIDADEKFLTFEPDQGGWNNIRMAMETVMVLAHATGRTLVLPPQQPIYLLSNNDNNNKKNNNNNNHFTFNDFFHLDSIATEHLGLKIITMEQFLTQKGITRQLYSNSRKKALTPPQNIANWDRKPSGPLWNYLRDVSYSPSDWEPSKCVAVIPSSPDPQHVNTLNQHLQDILDLKYGPIIDPGVPDHQHTFLPTDVQADTPFRLKEMLASRTKLCIYDQSMHSHQVLHFKVDRQDNSRLLTHFYAFIFFQDWKQDLYYKRFVRDHLRYVDQIVCAAARVVHAVRQKAISHSSEHNTDTNTNSNTNSNGEYDSFHVRRGDFQYKATRIDATQLYENSKDQLIPHSTLYIATDEKDKSFFTNSPLAQNYHLTFLDDYKHLLNDLSPSYYGMIDQLVAYKGRVFFGTWFSTLSGYVNRMRGYYIAKHKLEGYLDGTMQSYYFVPSDRKFQMTLYKPVKLPIYMREFPISWRDIDKGVEHDIRPESQL